MKTAFPFFVCVLHIFSGFQECTSCNGGSSQPQCHGEDGEQMLHMSQWALVLHMGALNKSSAATTTHSKPAMEIASAIKMICGRLDSAAVMTICTTAT
ncbi:hypothetical protein V5799_027323 [Amblyomma americanum]|uniref:Secreted protein n=1 Tax=Amblyomma americanum TaxID=6943 RepID=A0AAQ4DG20_AMBAM